MDREVIPCRNAMTHRGAGDRLGRFPGVAKSEPFRLVATCGPSMQTNPGFRFCDRAALSEVLAVAWKLAPRSNAVRAVLALLWRRPGAWQTPEGEALLRRVVGAVMERLGVDQHGEFVQAEVPDELEDEDELEDSRARWSRSPPGEVERLLSFYGIENRPWSPPPGWGQGALFDL